MPIYVGTQKIDVSGVKKVYVGTQLVYQDAPVLTSITLSGQTTSLNRGASFSFGGTVTAHYSNGSTANVTSSTTFSGYNMSTSGTYTVTASYTENGVTKTATYSLTVNPTWTTTYNNSSGVDIFTLSSPYTSWGGASSVPCNINNAATKLRITYRQDYSLTGGGVKTIWNNGGSTTSIDTTARTSNYTRTFDYTQGKDIVYFTITNKNSKTASCSWYKNGFWRGSIPSSFAMGGYLKIYKVEQYY